MSVYNIAKLMRPIAIMLIPVAIVLGLVVKSFVALVAWLLLNGLLAALTRCPQCGKSNYFNKDHPYKTFLAKPHPVCTNCGTRVA